MAAGDKRGLFLSASHAKSTLRGFRSHSGAYVENGFPSKLKSENPFNSAAIGLLGQMRVRVLRILGMLPRGET